MEDTTKFAIISDIHANFYALNSFLQFIEKNFKVDKILNLGDFVHIGPHPKEVTETILNDNRFVNIIGNNEMIVLGKRKSEWHQGIELHREWTINQLGEDLIKQIEIIPTFMTLNVNDKKLLLLHSHFYDVPDRSIQDNILLYKGKSLDEFINDYPKDADIVFIGHTHEQLYLNTKHKIIINPGSLSITKKPNISFCLMEIEGQKMNIMFKNIPYDVSNLKEDYSKRKVASREFLIKYFYPFL
ncbi:MAG: metallophosphoesterase family protein [Candidatus Hodarchaeota archaeon]